MHCLEDHISSLISSQQILPSRQELNYQEHAACHKNSLANLSTKNILYDDWFKHCGWKRSGLHTVYIQCNVHSWHTGRQQALSSNKDNLSLAETLLLGFISNLVIPVNATLSLGMMCKDIHVTLHKLKTMFFKHGLTICLWNSASWKPAITPVKSICTCIDLTLMDLWLMGVTQSSSATSC